MATQNPTIKSNNFDSTVPEPLRLADAQLHRVYEAHQRLTAYLGSFAAAQLRLDYEAMDHLTKAIHGETVFLKQVATSLDAQLEEALFVLNQ